MEDQLGIVELQNLCCHRMESKSK